MGKDVGWKGFLSDDERYADVINGIGCKGEQVIKKEDLQEMDTQTGFLRGPKFIRKLSELKKGKVKIRDCLRKVAFGMKNHTKYRTIKGNVQLLFHKKVLTF